MEIEKWEMYSVVGMIIFFISAFGILCGLFIWWFGFEPLMLIACAGAAIWLSCDIIHFHLKEKK